MTRWTKSAQMKGKLSKQLFTKPEFFSSYELSDKFSKLGRKKLLRT